MFDFQKYNFPKLGYIKVPRISIPNEEKTKYKLNDDYLSDDYLRLLVYDKFEQKIKSGAYPKDKYKQYKERLDFEFYEITRLKFSDYILLIYDVIRFCASNNILNGISRGSCGGSLLLSALDIVKLDPIKHSLLFERFISSARTEIKEIDGEIYIASESLPDFDLDSAASRKHDINLYLDSKFPNKTVGICNFSTLQSKALIKEVLKIYEGYKEEDAKEVSEMIESIFGKVPSINELLKNNHQFAEWAKDHKETINICCKLFELIKNISVHASGIFISELDLNDCVPVILSSDKKRICAYDMSVCSLFGIKLDNLGLKNLDIIREIIDQVGIKKLEDINVNDQSIYDFLKSNDNYYGVFQAEDGLGKTTLKRIKPDNLDDISLSLSLGRPGSIRYIDEAIKVKNGEIQPDIDERIAPILKDSYSVIAWQEQIMKISQVMAGFTPKQADRLRKGTGKKIRSIIQELRPQFIDGATKNGFSLEIAEKTFDVFEAAGDYSFNRSHSTGYAYITAICSYLKANYPVLFFTACLNNVKNEQNPIDEIKAIKKELFHFGIKLLPPHILKSGNLFTAENDSIRFPLSNIKGISEKSLAKLEKFKHSYSDKFQIFRAANEAKISISILSSLILAGCLDDFLTQTRTRTVLEACLWNLLTNREQNYVLEHGLEYNFDLVELVKGLNTKITDEKGRFIIKASRMETLRRNFRPYHEIYKNNTKNDKLSSYIHENMLLGYSFSTTLYDLFKPVCSNLSTFREFHTGLDDEYFKLVAKVKETKFAESKNNNKYLKISLETDDGELYAFIFNSKYSDRIKDHEETNGRICEENDIIICSGKKKGNAIFADFVSIQPYLIISKISELSKE